MKQWKRYTFIMISFGILLGLGIRYFDTVATITQKTALFSASLLLWEGQPNTSSPTATDVVSSPVVSHTTPASSIPVKSVTPPKGVETGKIQTTTLALSAANTKANGVHISNKTGRSIDIEDYLSQGMPFSLTDSDQPQVLIVHTHATEAYAESDLGYYLKTASTRSTDNKKNTVAVGEVLAEALNEAGIVTINDDTQHDYPNYTGGYNRSAETIKEYLEKYPSIKVVIDAHRDAIAGDGDTKLKPTTQINGKSAAQIMILAGCESGSVENFPNWEENFRFCLQLQKQLEADYPNLARPMSFKSCKYNFNLLSGSILIEIGTDANTLDEAKYSASLLARSFIQVLQP
ncbi:MAG: stage II sporulation protein P [Clostridia bacterium]|nr:stage II sporulation protein P [Clostridia bacterium]